MKCHLLKCVIIFLFLLNKPVNSNEIKEKEFTKIETKSNTYIQYSLQNNQIYEYLNMQFFLCEKNDENSHFSILNENNLIYETDIISSRQLIIPIKGLSNLKLNITSRGIYLNYQYTNTNKTILSLGIISSVNNSTNGLTINLSPVEINTKTTYQLFTFKKQMNNQCEILEYTNKNKPIQSQSLIETNNNFDLNFNNINIDNYILIKGIGVDDFNYVHLYNIILVKEKSSSPILLYILFPVLFIVIIGIIVLIILKKKEIICKKNNELTYPKTLFT